jgi:hypothetical protein
MKHLLAKVPYIKTIFLIEFWRFMSPAVMHQNLFSLFLVLLKKILTLDVPLEVYILPTAMA